MWVIHGEEPPQSSPEWASPKSQILEKQFDIISGPTHALLQSHLSPWASSKAHRCAWRSCQVPGSWWAVAGAPHTAEQPASPQCALCWWAAPLVCDLALCSLCSDAARLLLSQWDALDTQKQPVIILPKVVLGFWRLATWQQAHTALLAYPENALSGCLELRRSKIKFEGFKGRPSISDC